MHYTTTIRVPSKSHAMIAMTDHELKHYLTKRVIPDLQNAGFDSSLESDNDEDYMKLTIQRKHNYY